MNDGRRVDLIVSGVTSPSGYVDLYPDEPININYSIADVNDLTSKGGANSQSFICPGTPNNNNLFGQLFQIGSNGIFNPNQLVPATLLVDSIPVIRGVIQITGINVERDDGEYADYEVCLYDSSKLFQANIASNLINRLDWSGLNHYYTYTNIVDSWSGNSGYIYSLIDYGYDWTNVDLTTGAGVLNSQVFPGVFMNTLVGRIFTGNGFTYKITDPNFENILNRLYVPYNGNPQTFNTQDFVSLNSFQSNMDLSSQSVTAGYSTGYQSPSDLFLPYQNYDQIYDWTGNTSSALQFDDAIYNPGNLYQDARFAYSASTVTYQSFTFNVVVYVQIPYILGTGIISDIPLGYDIDTISGEFALYVNGSQVSPSIVPTIPFIIYGPGDSNATTPLPGYPDLTPYPYSGSPVTTAFGFQGTFTYPVGDYINPGDQVQLFLQNGWCRFAPHNDFNGDGTFISVNLNFASGSSWNNTVSSAIVPNQFIIFSGAVSQNTKQIDIITSLQSMFNLYFEPDPYLTNQINIAPRDSYFSSGKTNIWTEKWASELGIQEVLLSEKQLNRFILNYTDDSDYYNQNYKNITNITFGELLYYMPNSYTKGDDETDVIFSPTPGAPISGSLDPYFIIPKTIPYFAPGTISTAAGYTAGNIRILQYKYKQLQNGAYWVFTGNTFYNYPYGGMLDDPQNSTVDLSFSSSTYQYFVTPASGITQNNLANLFWLNYLNQISDPTSKMITAKFWLKPSDIVNFRYNDQIFVDGLTSESGYFYVVNSITWDAVHDYVPATVELIKLPYPFLDINYAGRNNNIVKTIGTLGGWSQSSSNLTLGSNGTIGSNKTVVIGDATVASNSSVSVAIGDGATIGAQSANSHIQGENSTIGSGNKNNSVRGYNNKIK